MQEYDPAIAVVEIYDPATDRWSRGTDMPTPRAGPHRQRGRWQGLRDRRHPSCRHRGPGHGRGVRSTGRIRGRARRTCRPHGCTCRARWWTERSSWWAAARSGRYRSAATEMYDPATDTWTKMADMPTPRIGVWAAALGGKVYVMGGLSWENQALRTVEAFDPKTNSWRQVPDMPTARFILTAEAICRPGICDRWRSNRLHYPYGCRGFHSLMVSS